MIFKLVLETQRTWKRINGYEFIPLVLENKKFVNGDLEEAAWAMRHFEGYASSIHKI
jgi:hypothetical protein